MKSYNIYFWSLHYSWLSSTWLLVICSALCFRFIFTQHFYFFKNTFYMRLVVLVWSRQKIGTSLTGLKQLIEIKLFKYFFQLITNTEKPKRAVAILESFLNGMIHCNRPNVLLLEIFQLFHLCRQAFRSRLK